VTGPVWPLQNKLNLFGPPHGSVALPVHAMLQSAAFAAGAAPGAILESQTVECFSKLSIGIEGRPNWGL
jgi:hypothetical protein